MRFSIFYIPCDFAKDGITANIFFLLNGKQISPSCRCTHLFLSRQVKVSKNIFIKSNSKALPSYQLLLFIYVFCMRICCLCKCNGSCFTQKLFWWHATDSFWHRVHPNCQLRFWCWLVKITILMFNVKKLCDL